MEFEQILMQMKPGTPKTIAVAAAHDKAVLGALCTAHRMGFANAILCGDAQKINANAAAENLDISHFEIIDEPDVIKSADVAVSLVRNGRADILMKGLLQTADMLRAVINRDTGIRGDGVISHVAILYNPTLNKRFFLTDVAMLTEPDLQTKVAIIKNAVHVARRMGVAKPLVAPLCAVEVVNPKMQATLDAAELSAMNTRGEITDCIVEGPLAFDGAVSPIAAAKKGLSGSVAGNADILLFHNIEAGNSTLKAMTGFGGFIFGGVLIGATVPIIVNSRSDDETSKLYSIACACAI